MDNKFITLCVGTRRILKMIEKATALPIRKHRILSTIYIGERWMRWALPKGNVFSLALLSCCPCWCLRCQPWNPIYESMEVAFMAFFWKGHEKDQWKDMIVFFDEIIFDMIHLYSLQKYLSTLTNNEVSLCKIPWWCFILAHPLRPSIAPEKLVEACAFPWA